jgi:ABC-type Fe3+-hydroxamate transport system substrate-binding protein
MLLALAFAASASVRVVDDRGRELNFEAPPQRIVSLAPHATELLFAAGASAQVVAVDLHSDRPDRARRLPRLNAHPAPDPERLLALQPDLVVLWGAAADQGRLERLERLGLKVFVSEPRSLEMIASTLERFAGLLPAPRDGLARAAGLRATIQSLRKEFASRQAVRVFVQAWSRPLTSLSDRDTIGDALKLCGAVNLFGASALAAPQVGVESVLAAKPDLILAFEPQADRGIWDAIGALVPPGSIRFAALGRSLLRPSDGLIDELPALCAAVDAARR